MSDSIAYGIRNVGDLLAWIDKMRPILDAKPEAMVFIEGADAGFVVSNNDGDVLFYDGDSVRNFEVVGKHLPFGNCEQYRFTGQQLYDLLGHDSDAESVEEFIADCIHGGSITAYDEPDGSKSYSYHG